MKSIDKPAAQLIRKELDQLLAEFNKTNKHNLTVTLGKGSFDRHCINFQLSAAVPIDGVSADIPATKAAIDFARHADLLDMKVSDLGRKFDCNGITFTFAGYKPRATKKPFVATDPTGAEFIFPKSIIKQKLCA
tara:strand:+ start:13813 stop:14214 length:402 start_codon:yes stop_codon:yes gene_type:complete